MGKHQVLVSVVAALSMSAAVLAYAESAPVYDADSMPPNDYSLDQPAQSSSSAQDQGQDYPMPPPPGQEGAYVPPQPPANTAPTVAAVPDNSAQNDKRIKQIEKQVSRLETDSSAARVEALQKEVQALRGQVEQLTHQAQKMQEQQKNMYSDLDKRVAPDISANQKVASAKKSAKTPTPDDDSSAATTDSTATAAATAPAANNADQPNVAEEQKIYQTAYNQIKAKKYEDAVKTLQGMLKKYPSGQFASNAHYWLGELYGLMGKHEEALKEFNTVATDYPSSPRVSDAQLKIGLIYAAQFNWSEAKSTFKKIINRYPGTASARLASEQLKQIKDAGH